MSTLMLSLARSAKGRSSSIGKPICVGRVRSRRQSELRLSSRPLWSRWCVSVRLARLEPILRAPLRHRPSRGGVWVPQSVLAHAV